jgi:transposase InsO family protein
MEQVYNCLKITRQAYHKHVKQPFGNEQLSGLFMQATKLRLKHGRMGCRKIANRIKREGYGRDKVEAMLLQSGFRVPRKIKHIRTTLRQREMYFPNLIQGMKLKAKNRLIQTDITYYSVGDRHYYMVFIIDVYTRRIIGYNLGTTLKATENIKALKMAFKTRSGDDLSGLIHHSDKGSQYIEREYLKLLNESGIQVSMCDYAWENAYSERINRTIKEEYLETKNIQTLKQFQSELKRAVYLYNHDRGHKNLPNQMPPVQFEQYLLTIDPSKHPEMELYSPSPEVINRKWSY